MLVNPKQIEDPDNEGQMIDNPDYDPTKNEDGTPIENPEEENDERTELQKLLDQQKADFKKKLDAIDAKLKAAEAEKAKLEKAERDRETQKLKDEGKLQEAHERELADRDARIKQLEESNVALGRDGAVRDALGTYEFKNAKAQKMAIADITAELVKNDDGEWTHKSGQSITDFAKSFFDDEDNAFYLKTKKSSGTGVTTTPPPKPTEKKSASLFDMDVTDVFKMAEKGQLPNQR